MYNKSAFPSEDGPHTNYGMDLRDYHASNAMQSFIGEYMQSLNPSGLDSELSNQAFVTNVAKLAYQMADAMIAEGGKSNG